MIYSMTGCAHKVFLGSLLDLGATYKIQTRCTLGGRSQESSAGSQSAGFRELLRKQGGDVLAMHSASAKPSLALCWVLPWDLVLAL